MWASYSKWDALDEDAEPTDATPDSTFASSLAAAVASGEAAHKAAKASDAAAKVWQPRYRPYDFAVLNFSGLTAAVKSSCSSVARP